MPPISQNQPLFKRPLFILTIIVTTIGLSIFLNLDRINNSIPDKTIQKENQILHERINLLEKEIEELTEPPPVAVQPHTVKGSEAHPPSIDLSGITCQELDEKVKAFFDYLDEQDYMVSYNLKDGSQAHFKQLIDKLLANPPIVARETDSLFTIITNTAHFYRVLGKDNVLMARDIVVREANILESTFALFDQLSQSGSRCQDLQTNIQIPLSKLYEYAGFFLNTLGGQSYLFRRNSHIRLLIKYYCVMVLDRANAEIINRHGIDISPPLESLIDDIEIGETMVYKEQYLRTLRELQSKYQIHYEDIAEALPSNYGSE